MGNLKLSLTDRDNYRIKEGDISTNIGFLILWLLPEKTFIVCQGLARDLIHCLDQNNSVS